MPTLHVLRVFVGADGEHGNPLGVFVDGAAVPPEHRQVVAADLGFSETVYVDDLERGDLHIFTPAEELPFAGHPLVGTSWLLRDLGATVDTLRPPAGEVGTWVDGDGLTWIRGRPAWSPEFQVRELGSAEEVEGLEPHAFTDGHHYLWAWLDEETGVVRSRMFAPSFGIAEDEATGSAALRLGGELGRPLTVHQGRGSVLHVRPQDEGWVAVGGTVVHDETREYALAP